MLLLVAAQTGSGRSKGRSVKPARSSGATSSSIEREVAHVAIRLGFTGLATSGGQSEVLADARAFKPQHRKSLPSSVSIMIERAAAGGLDSSLMVVRPRPKRDHGRDQRLAPFGQRIVNSRRDRRIAGARDLLRQRRSSDQNESSSVDRNRVSSVQTRRDFDLQPIWRRLAPRRVRPKKFEEAR